MWRGIQKMAENGERTRRNTVKMWKCENVIEEIWTVHQYFSVYPHTEIWIRILNWDIFEKCHKRIASLQNTSFAWCEWSIWTFICRPLSRASQHQRQRLAFPRDFKSKWCSLSFLMTESAIKFMISSVKFPKTTGYNICLLFLQLANMRLEKKITSMRISCLTKLVTDLKICISKLRFSRSSWPQSVNICRSIEVVCSQLAAAHFIVLQRCQ